MEEQDTSQTEEFQIYYRIPEDSDYSTLTQTLDKIFAKLSELENKVNAINNRLHDH